MSPSDINPAVENPEGAAVDTAQRILEAARRVFAEKGFEAASLREIAEEARVSKALVLWYFKSKEELVKRIAMESLPTGVAAACIDRGLRGSELVACIIDTFLDRYRSETQRRLLIHSLSLALRSPEIARELRELCRRMTIEVAERAYGSRTPRDMARARSLFGALLCHAISPVEEMGVEELRRALVELFSPAT
ncbi:MAG: TetR/AcrR family transcriptional regulator [Crenarchaeota archaeon]|nr:TetR/AcrR family transcriptional regulator [Thermoproteota archaeon]